MRTLQSGIKSGRIAHAYLFTGPRGTGKTSSARLLAKALNCEKGPLPEPCNECGACQGITLGNAMDVIEVDAASESGVEEVREAIVQASEYLPTSSRYKVYIIDEVHDLSAKAFDALLKTIEEPPAHVIFILATTEPTKVPVTIRSRCQKHEFRRANMTELISRLTYVAESEGVQIESAAITALARLADGGYRDALTNLEQVMITADGPITLSQVYDQLGLVSGEVSDQIIFAVKSNDTEKLLRTIEEINRIGRDPRSILESLQYRLADLTRSALGLDSGAGEATTDAAARAIAADLGKDFILALRGEFAQIQHPLTQVTLPRIWLESEMIRISNVLRNPQPVRLAAPPAQPVARREETSQAARPMPSTPSSPEVAPAVEPVREKPKPATAVAEVAEPFLPPEPTGNAELDEARQMWYQLVSSLPDGTPIALRMKQAVVTERKDLDLSISLPRRLDVPWAEDPKRKTFLSKQLKEQTGKDWNLTFHGGGAAPT